MPIMNNELRNYVFRLLKSKIIRCLEPSETCTANGIRSHSLQNAAVLSALHEDGHVIAPRPKLDHTRSLVFERVGRNRATTFTGLCPAHDRSIFRPIETSEIDVTNPRHLFLLAYRAVLRELHATLEAAIKTQLGYQKKGEVGLIPVNTPTPEGMAAVKARMLAVDTYEYKRLYDQALLADDLSAFSHRVLFFSGLAPTIAVNSLFHAGEGRLALNVFPTQQGVAAIFSHHASDARAVAPFVDDLPTTCQPGDLERLSSLVVVNCENFVLAPAFVRHLTKKQQQQVLDLALATLHTREAPPNAPAINLFQQRTDSGVPSSNRV